MIPESNLSSGGCTLKTAERPIHTPRPQRPLARRALSGSNPALCRRSARRGRERQLSYLANAYSVPVAVFRFISRSTAGIRVEGPFLTTAYRQILRQIKMPIQWRQCLGGAVEATLAVGSSVSCPVLKLETELIDMVKPELPRTSRGACMPHIRDKRQGRKQKAQR